MQIRKQELELDREEQTGSKQEKEYVKPVYCHPAYLTYIAECIMRNTAGGSTGWNQDCWENYQ